MASRPKLTKNAHYRCVRCAYEFWEWPGFMKSDGMSQHCPRCDHEYVEWLNYSPQRFKGWRQ